MAKRPAPERFAPDLDEIAPNTFLIHNDKLRPVLRGEGVTVGHTFELVSTRRAGLLARLRVRGFNVRTLYSRLQKLPPLPKPLALGDERSRVITRKEHWSAFDLVDLRWHELPRVEEPKPAITVRIGQVLRRRMSRSSGAFFIADLDNEGALSLRGASETEAVLQGYAQATAEYDIEVTAHPRPEDHYELMLNYVLPPPYLKQLQLCGERTKHGVLIGPGAWDLALLTLHRLNLRPDHGDREVTNPDVDPTFDPSEDGGDDFDD